ncbi:MAG: hypothetical protein WCH75_10170, partial [Candidatus Binatia bacterium]
MRKVKCKLFFSGIDGSGKTACSNLLLSKLDSRYRIIEIGSHDLYLSFKGQKQLLLKRSLPDKRDYLKKNTFKRTFYGLFLILNFLQKFIASKYIEFSRKGDLIIYDVDQLFHPTVYMAYHFPFLRRLKGQVRFRILAQLFRSEKSSLRVYL